MKKHAEIWTLFWGNAAKLLRTVKDKLQLFDDLCCVLKNILCIAELWLQRSSCLLNRDCTFSDMCGSIGPKFEPKWHILVPNWAITHSMLNLAE